MIGHGEDMSAEVVGCVWREGGWVGECVSLGGCGDSVCF